MKTFAILTATLFVGALTLAQGQTTPTLHPPVRDVPDVYPPPYVPTNPADPQFGDPLVGLTQAQLAEFFTGKNRFVFVETVQSGLGPIYNGDSCMACHGGPAIGGSSAILATRFGGTTAAGAFDPLAGLDGTLLHQSSIVVQPLEFVPIQATVVANRKVLPLFGDGLINGIPDATIQAGAAVSKPYGIKGVVATLTDPATGQTRVGRFGWKAQQAGILGFAAQAYEDEMGITNSIYTQEKAPNGNTALLNQLETVTSPQDTPDPVTG
jgi:CxxC motif-containing protein (DUF1111 family)